MSVLRAKLLEDLWMVPGMVSSFFRKALLLHALKAHGRGEDMVAIPPRTPLEGKETTAHMMGFWVAYIYPTWSHGEGVRRDGSYILVVLLLPRDRGRPRNFPAVVACSLVVTSRLFRKGRAFYHHD